MEAIALNDLPHDHKFDGHEIHLVRQPMTSGEFIRKSELDRSTKIDNYTGRVLYIKDSSLRVIKMIPRTERPKDTHTLRIAEFHTHAHVVTNISADGEGANGLYREPSNKNEHAYNLAMDVILGDNYSPHNIREAFVDTYHDIDITKIEEAENGLHITGTDLVVFLNPRTALNTPHITEKGSNVTWLNSTGFNITIQLEENTANAFYMNIFGKPVKVKTSPRTATTNPPVEVTTICEHTSKPITTFYSLEALLEGDGIDGIRLYKTKSDALDDINRDISETVRKDHEREVDKLTKQQQVAKKEKDIHKEIIKDEEDKAKLAKRASVAKDTTSITKSSVEAIVGSIALGSVLGGIVAKATAAFAATSILTNPIFIGAGIIATGYLVAESACEWILDKVCSIFGM